MKILKELAILIAVCLASIGIAAISPFPLPTSIIAMVLLFLLLLLRILKTEQVEKTADFFLSNIALFFIPASVGIIKSASLLKNNVWSLVIILIVSTLLTFFVSYYVTAGVATWMNRQKENKK